VIETLQKAVQKAKIGQTDKAEALKKLHQIAAKKERDFIPTDNLQTLIEKEREESWKYGGKTVLGDSRRIGDAEPPKRNKGVQLRLF
ncbi:MAG: DUF763 domain-containing protein, partial [Bacteroidota bacterium]|nr:DUF763 domain-containing protein [Bacteroidota bacterium]